MSERCSRCHQFHQEHVVYHKEFVFIVDNQDISRKIVSNLLAFHLRDSLRDSLGRQFKVMAEQLGGLQLQLDPQ